MVRCRHCHVENIDGEEHCENCGQSLDDAHLRPPPTEAARSLLSDRVSVFAPQKPIAVAPATPVGAVLRLMVQRQIGCVVVAHEGMPLGIFSERDALRKLNTSAVDFGARPVSEFMTHSPQTLMADAKIAFAVQRMDLGGFRHLPIVDHQGALTGVISARDILQYLTNIMSRGD